MSRADIIKEGRLSKPWEYFDVAWNSSSSKYNIDGLYGFQSFPLTVKSSLKNQSIEVRRIQRLAFFFFNEQRVWKDPPSGHFFCHFDSCSLNRFPVGRLNPGLAGFDLKNVTSETPGKGAKEVLRHTVSNIYDLFLWMWLICLKVNSTQVKKKITTLCVTKICITLADIYKTLDDFSRVSPRKKKAQLIKNDKPFSVKIVIAGHSRKKPGFCLQLGQGL